MLLKVSRRGVLLADFVDANVLEIAHREEAHLVHHLHAPGHPPDRKLLVSGAFPDLVIHLDRKLQELLGAGYLDAAEAAHRHGLQVFGAHDRAHARAASGVAGFADQTGELHQVFPARADADHLNLRVS